MESAITKKVNAYLKTIKYITSLHYYKVSDRYTSGIPDYIGVMEGVPFAIELKDEGKLPRKLQALTMQEMRHAGWKILSTDKMEDVTRFFINFDDTINRFKWWYL